MQKVSVITIARNDLFGVQRTVASVAEQDWPNVEHIVVDADSTDGTRDYLASLGDSLVWVSEPDSGRYDGMNKGVSLSSGEYLWFMHSSDTFGGVDSISIAMCALERTGRQWGYGLSRIGGRLGCIGVGGTIPFNFGRFMLGGRIIPHQATVVSRRIHTEVGGYDEGFGIGADQYYLMALAALAQPEAIPEFLCDFDAAGAGSTRSMWSHYRDMGRARRMLGVSPTGSVMVDSAWSAVAAISAKADRIQRRLLARRTQPANSAGRDVRDPVGESQ